MKKALISGLFLFIGISCFAQNDDVQHRAKMAALKKDTAFKRFQSEFTTIMKTANKSNTNFNRIKTLFATNNALLKALKTKYKLQKRLLIAPTNSVDISKKRPALYSKIVKTETYTAPYTAKEIYENASNHPALSTADDQLGKIVWTETATPGDANYFSPYIYSFRQTIQVPTNPVIVAARVKFYYSYFYTGWDTEEGFFFNSLRIIASSGFNSPAYNDLPLNRQTTEPKVWRTITSSNYAQFFEEIHDYSKKMDTSFQIEGYVVPGSTLDFKVGIVHDPGGYTGHFGAYHYAEYYLKKIEIIFLKAGD